MDEKSLNALESRVSKLCDAVMRGTAEAIRRTGRKPADLDQVVAVMRAEVKAFIFGDEYKTERDAVMMGSLADGWIISSIVAGVVGKIEWTPAATVTA